MIRFLLVFAGLLGLHACAHMSTIAPLYTLWFPEMVRGDGQDRIELYESAVAECGPGAKRAAYVFRPIVRAKPEMSGKTVEGCYIIRGETVYMIFIDGDSGDLPLQAFKDGRLPTAGARGAVLI